MKANAEVLRTAQADLRRSRRNARRIKGLTGMPYELREALDRQVLSARRNMNRIDRARWN